MLDLGQLTSARDGCGTLIGGCLCLLEYVDANTFVESYDDYLGIITGSSARQLCMESMQRLLALPDHRSQITYRTAACKARFLFAPSFIENGVMLR